MANSIFDTAATWAAFTFFQADTILLAGGLYYYAVVDHTSTADFSGDVNTSHYWDGIGLDSQNRQLTRFFWPISYGSPTNVNPKINITKMGDGYSQRTPDGINNILLSFDIIINGLTQRRCAAISHFLYRRGGDAAAFYWIAPAPFNILKRYICTEWSATPDFFDNYSIKGKFEEVSY